MSMRTRILNGATVRPELTEDICAVDVTPDIARRWLGHNTHNRGLKPRSISRFSEDMETGEWQWTGEPVRFATDGTLLDGQNRLHAVIDSDVTVPMLVILNLPMASQRDVDTGQARKLHDVLVLNGETNATHLAAAVRRCEAWERGARRSAVTFTDAPISRCIAFLDEHPELRDVVSRAKSVAGSCYIPASVLALAWWVFDQIDEEDAEFFFTRLGDGQGLVKGDPIYELRGVSKANSENVRGERSQVFLLAITIKAWNAYRRGEPIGQLKFRMGGAKPEQFPEPS